MAEQKRWKNTFIILKILFGLSLFAYILTYKFNFSVFGDIKFLWPWFFLMLVNSTFISFLRVNKWDILLNNYFAQKYSFRKNWDTIMTGQFFAFFTPSRLGDFIRMKYTRKELGYKKSFIAVVIDRVVDLMMMGILALIGLVYFREEFITNPGRLLAVIFIAILGGVAVLILLRKQLIKFSRPVLNIFRRVSVRHSGNFLLLAAAVWLLTFTQFYFAFNVIGMSTSIIPVILMAAIGMVVIMMPISVNGIGIREFVAITLFPLAVTSGEKAVVALWIVMLANSVYPAVLGFFSFTKS